MSNELGRIKAAIAKQLLNEGYDGQQISILFGVNSRAVSHVKSKEEYTTLKPDTNHGIPDEIFNLTMYDILNILGSDKIKELSKIHLENQKGELLKMID